jgi:hypothetical protein
LIFGWFLEREREPHKDEREKQMKERKEETIRIKNNFSGRYKMEISAEWRIKAKI